MIWSSAELSESLGVLVHASIEGRKLQINSNDVSTGDIFIALKGTKSHGHDYALKALENGASAVLVSRVLETSPADIHKVIVVEDTLAALNRMASYKRSKSEAIFIAITGSVGKTSTTEATRIILDHFAPTFGSRAKFNGQLGTPLNLASMPNAAQYAILELGMSQPGEMRILSRMVRPDVGIITNVSEAHLESFNSVKDIADAKCEIFEGMDPEQGIVILNLDCEFYPRVLKHLEKLHFKNIFTFGTGNQGTEPDSKLELYEVLNSETVHLIYVVKRSRIEVDVPFIPQHMALNFTIPLLLVSIFGRDVREAVLQIPKFQLDQGRGKIVQVECKNGGSFSILCDYYNASPQSMRASLRYLKQIITQSKKVAILGDMLELGEASVELHKSLVTPCIDSGASKIFLVGPQSKYIYELLLETENASVNLNHFENVDKLILKLNDIIEPNEFILIKGSRGMKLEAILHYLQNK